jgi:hypothetical protein
MVNELGKDLEELVELDHGYQSSSAKNYDQSWRLVQKGYIGDADTNEKFKKLPVIDEYRFVRKNFHKAWVFYVLIIRLVTFKNPIVEVFAYVKTRQVKRVDEHQHPITHPEYNDFKSELIQQQPLVSVIIPTLNRYRYLKDVLKDLELQEYRNFEVIVVDQSEPFQNEFYEEFQLNINLIYQEEKALWLARNTAIKQSKGEYVLLFDDDSRVDKDWITQHLKTLDFLEPICLPESLFRLRGLKCPLIMPILGLVVS